MRIGELSRRTGVSGPALRYYEEQGLLHPRRSPSGYREYGEDDVARVGNIRTLLAAGLGTALIAEILPCMVVEGRYLAPVCPEITDALEAERLRITTAIAELERARTALDGIISAPVPESAVAEACADDYTQEPERAMAG
ncbi:MerR family transcriptional regulator [Streptomonospora nanhaiensis]|uniref:DNA-binding transcriptional MerR regulator n=1 Tax=Streptomonospora nanhaiensis TaxID=1323731 RepID=A0A853BPD5_9ACTN|nr:MerR family transcriptional regulator [Streptomonospora nanhaiensis]MBV2362238.1 MerR family transcriptional regulator [Streptomonospora nanhaiensis]MBX9387830.1 MerR family transcriptional regulator [Streptomonospora nanhaiensis]NYI97308.1 DNA-binding transcriptional MerR regulator [Streptomonospora nanhaiensis]